MSATEVFDVCIVGAGLWGSAAAKYCSQRPNTSVCLIGPSEPVTKEDYESRSVFGAHYDEGRIFATFADTFEWGELARRAVDQFSKIEEMTGVHFYNNVGFLWLTARDSLRSQKLLDVARRTGNNVRVLDQTTVQQRFKILSLATISQQENMAKGVVGTLQETGAGHLSPRKLLHAQQILAQRQGCKILDDIVTDLSQDQSKDIFTLTTISGETIQAKKVLLCTGASTVFENLLPAEMQPDLTVYAHSVVLVELTEDDRDRLRDMPSLLNEEETDYGLNCYILPPIQYPDGKWYLKIGHCVLGRKEVTSKEQLKAWYCSSGDPDTSHRLLHCIQDMIPGLKPLSTHTKTCVITSTPTGDLYCDMVIPGLGILVGCNGVGAKSSDEIGRMGAQMILKGVWDYDLPRETFRVQWKPKNGQDAHT